jgi:hypothetical protein
LSGSDLIGLDAVFFHMEGFRSAICPSSNALGQTEEFWSGGSGS